MEREAGERIRLIRAEASSRGCFVSGASCRGPELRVVRGRSPEARARKSWLMVGYAIGISGRHSGYAVAAAWFLALFSERADVSLCVRCVQRSACGRRSAPGRGADSETRPVEVRIRKLARRGERGVSGRGADNEVYPAEVRIAQRARPPPPPHRPCHGARRRPRAAGGGVGQGGQVSGAAACKRRRPHARRRPRCRPACRLTFRSCAEAR